MKNAIKILVALLVVCAMAVTVSADAFAPSVAQKDVPAVTVDALVDADGNAVEGGAVTVTSVAKAKGEAKAAIEAAMETLAEAAEDMVVVDVCYVEANETVEEALEKGGCVALTFDLKVSPKADVTVMVFADGEWVTLPADAVVVNADGSVTVTTNLVGVFAFAI